jgi:hypothetical protein
LRVYLTTLALALPIPFILLTDVRLVVEPLSAQSTDPCEPFDGTFENGFGGWTITGNGSVGPASAGWRPFQ